MSRPPLVLVNAVHSKAGGGRIFLEEVAPRLAQARDGARYVVLARPEQAPTYLRFGCQVTEVRPPQGPVGTVLWNQTRLVRLARSMRAAVVFTQANVGSFPLGRRSVTLLGNSLRAAGDARGLRSRLYWRTLSVLTGWSLAASGSALVVSESFRDELVERFGVERERLSVLHHGVSRTFRADLGVDLPDDPFVLSVGDVYPHKNYVRLVEAFARLRPEERGLTLRIAGRELDARCSAEVRAAASRLGLEDRVRLLGWTDREDLARLYRSAAVVALPSTAETFGIATAEALACGAVVVASDLPFGREVAGDAAILVDPSQAESIAEGIGRALDDDALRDRLRSAGAIRARRFDWDATAEKLHRYLSGRAEEVRS